MRGEWIKKFVRFGDFLKGKKSSEVEEERRQCEKERPMVAWFQKRKDSSYVGKKDLSNEMCRFSFDFRGNDSCQVVDASD